MSRKAMQRGVLRITKAGGERRSCFEDGTRDGGKESAMAQKGQVILGR